MRKEISSSLSAVGRCEESLTLTVREYAKLVGVGEGLVRQEIAAGRLPHKKLGKRGLIRILRRPALRELELDERESV
jgi:excisionase family DNA binding protein